jgi:hypothetical protein
LFKCLFYFKRSTATAIAFVRYHNNDNLFLKVFGLILFISGATKSTVVALSAAAGAACGPGQ